jgi:hypothetical protein
VAAWLDESEDSVRAQTARGLLPHRYLGRRLIYLKHELEQYFEQLPGLTLQQALHNLRSRNGQQGD